MKGNKQGVFKIILLFCFFLPATANAYGPFSIYPEDKGGTAYKWKDGVVTWKYDAGPLSKRIPSAVPKDNKDFCKQAVPEAKPCEYMVRCGAVMCLNWLINKWEGSHLLLADKDNTNVKTASLSIENGGPMDGDVDINAGNIDEYWQKAVEQDIVLIVFDEDGKIIEDSGGSPQGQLGLSVPNKSETSPFFKGGIAVFNGLHVDGESDDKNPEVDDKKFAATMLHEFGHVLGLDHTQPKTEVMGPYAKGPKVPEGIPTMYSYLVDEGQLELNIDDVIGISSLYPSKSFNNKFCTLRGSLEDEKGEPFQGINIISYADVVGEDIIDVRSNVSGVLYPAGTKNGDYVLSGIIPCKPYKVIYEPVIREFQEFQTGLNPYNGKFHGPTEADLNASGEITVGGGGANTIVCNISNMCGDLESVPAKELLYVSTERDIDMDIPPPLPKITTTNGPENKKKGWCMSLGQGSISPLWALLWPALIGIGVAFRRMYI